MVEDDGFLLNIDESIITNRDAIIKKLEHSIKKLKKKWEKMRLFSWNVNGVRAATKKGLFEWLEHESPDILCIQETKA